MNKAGSNCGHFWSIQYKMLIFTQIAPVLSMEEANEHILVVLSVSYDPDVSGYTLWAGSVCTQFS